jgi:hypothetical protein
MAAPSATAGSPTQQPQTSVDGGVKLRLKVAKAADSKPTEPVKVPSGKRPREEVVVPVDEGKVEDDDQEEKMEGFIVVKKKRVSEEGEAQPTKAVKARPKPVARKPTVVDDETMDVDEQQQQQQQQQEEEEEEEVVAPKPVKPAKKPAPKVAKPPKPEPVAVDADEEEAEPAEEEPAKPAKKPAAKSSKKEEAVNAKPKKPANPQFKKQAKSAAADKKDKDKEKKKDEADEDEDASLDSEEGDAAAATSAKQQHAKKERLPAGAALLKTEREKIEKAIESTQKKIDSIGAKYAGQRYPASVRALLSDAVHGFWNDAIKEFDRKFAKYVETPASSMSSP